MSKKDSSRFDALFGAARASKPEEENKVEPSTGESDRALSKGKDPSYQRTTVYLPKSLHRKFKAAALEEEREMSDVVEELVREWLDSKTNV